MYFSENQYKGDYVRCVQKVSPVSTCLEIAKQVLTRLNGARL